MCHRLVVAWFLAGFAAVPAFASEGVIEINEACALNTGCFPGDAPGYPVTITQTGSYRLTSDLDLRGLSASATAVSISAQFATLDLGGFVVRGPTVCAGTPTTGCAPAGSGVGIDGVSFVTVKNGIVTGFASDGVRLQHGVRVEALQSIANGGSGVVAGDQSEMRWIEATLNRVFGIQANIEAMLDHVSAVGNGNDGVRVASGVLTDDNASRNGGYGANIGATTAFSGCHFAANASGSRTGGKAVGGNVCDDGRCARTGAKRFMLSVNAANGASALAACPSGFHMANLWEILDPSSLEYTVGATASDSGSGPPSAASGGADVGWVRTGFPAASNANCSSWQSAVGTDSGAAAWLDMIHVTSTPRGAAEVASPWHVDSLACSSSHAVWCIED